MTHRRRPPAAALAAVFVLLAGCGAGVPGASDPAATALATPSADLPRLLARTYEVGPRPGPVKPFRGEMVQDVQVYQGWVTMRFLLRNTGDEPVTFLNTLYDYEPLQLYEPLVRLEWTDGIAAVASRRGRFFPTPAILQPGQEAVYLMGAQPALEAGSGELGDLVTHIKYCPTRGMDDVPGVPLRVTDLEWETRDGITTVRGVLHETQGSRRLGSPTVGVEFIGPNGEFLGAIVEDAVGERIEPGESRAFEISGPGVRARAAVELRGSAWIR
ncbi:MAG TPA: hypothetical protein VHK63_08865 [Candidatus Limnocylindria bacterium]|nr:hypothetical protein [Candidatus Limnocylindria bacterium]